ncbi:MAG: hypothetical protein IH859_04500 [Chloroflexi bacterium]|nr:hypothetical protein [Chloroflexota bacterium]
MIDEEGIDMAILLIWDNNTMGSEDALQAVKLIPPKHVLPVHIKTWCESHNLDSRGYISFAGLLSYRVNLVL